VKCSTMLGFVVFGVVIITIPADDAVDPDGKVDWIGAYLGVTGLILFNFVWKCVSFLSWHLFKLQRLAGLHPTSTFC
jgi:hypothetical protein